MGGVAETLIEDGKAALHAGDGVASQRAFEEALAHGESGAALDGLAQTAYIQQNYDSAIAFFERSYAAYRDEEDHVGAIQVASKLGWLNAGYRGDEAVMSGWIARAQTLLGAEDTVEHGWVEYYRGMFAPLGPERDEHLRIAVEAGRRFGVGDLEFVALAQLGSGLVHSDRFEEGMVLLDESLAAVAGGEATDFNIVEIIFCQLFSACEYAHDIARAEQWNRLGEDIASRRKLPGVAAWCRTHYGAILTAAGRWPEADAELSEAVRTWANNFASMRWTALVRLADLRVRQGRFEEAEQLLQGLDVYTEAARPLAAIHLARGKTSLAAEVLERSLEQMQPDAASAAPLWALMVDALLESGAVAGAVAAAERLEAIVARSPSHYLRATAALARGRVCLATGSGDPRTCLREALSGFAQAQMPMELANARLDLARALTAERPEVAVAEAKAALEAFERLQAARLADGAAAMLRSLGAPVRVGPKGSDSLTKRETEVLELIGRGLSNPEISDRLYISRKTVEHHVGRILSKLGMRSRAEAAAHAAREEKPATR
jgi:DNA-binding CsgD family transcriptional regulator